jgi:hypothetical protein
MNYMRNEYYIYKSYYFYCRICIIHTNMICTYSSPLDLWLIQVQIVTEVNCLLPLSVSLWRHSPCQHVHHPVRSKVGFRHNIQVGIPLPVFFQHL